MTLAKYNKYDRDSIQVAGFNDGSNHHILGVAIVDGTGAQIVNLTNYQFEVHDFEEASATQLYLGQLTAANIWLVASIDTTTGVVIRYAGVANNATVTTYAAAWTARATLTYGRIDEALA